MLTEEQAEQIKNQLFKQLDKFPEEQRGAIRKRIVSMSIKELEEFIKQNQLTHLEEKKEGSTKTNCIFCNIVSGEISSFVLSEDKDNVAVLEINPLSKGHSLVIPKKHKEITQIPQSAFSLAKKIAIKIRKNFKPKEIKINAEKIMNHGLIEIIPLYGDETERRKASERELVELQVYLKIEEKPKKIIIKKEIPKEVQKQEGNNLPRFRPRIP